ncbi:ATP-binding protein (plasmid) [Agrobacterium tumefaciens]|jgi:SpoVK/Ycf46/Vps4 family AAA+-type ATPase|uniref:AAA family ATPase n=1 Tax=Agrobacterium tumefaciens TaxID=358 RepID=UPI001B89E5AF|nr:ATP-binding protein [Agrobacterium tumefaciens]WCA72622.1 ATP-binding protein [Agrobacterium tumefaciens]
MSEGNVGEIIDISTDLAQSIRLGLKSEVDGMRLFAAKLVRKYRQSAPDLSRQIDEYLQAAPVASPMRKKTLPKADQEVAAENDDAEELALLRIDTAGAVEPLLSETVRLPVQQLLAERRQIKKLQSLGLEPMRSAVFVGPPGVGKTMTAKWIAAELGLPLLVLDLTAIMSSYLGRTGNNLRAVLNYAKSIPCVLLLDEIDAIAKRRGDMSDVGELKRLVTVILQEIDAWPSTSLLLAATNHAELIDPALWRRFDQTVEFPQPDKRRVEELLRKLTASEGQQFDRWVPTMAMLLEGYSFSDIERTARQFRKATTLKTATIEELVEGLARRHAALLDRESRQDLARKLTDLTRLSQHKVSDITGVSRDTIRKYQKQEHVTHGD